MPLLSSIVNRLTLRDKPAASPKVTSEQGLARLGQHNCLERVTDFLSPMDRINLFAAGRNIALQLRDTRAIPLSFRPGETLTISEVKAASKANKRTAKAIELLAVAERVIAQEMPTLSFSAIAGLSNKIAVAIYFQGVIKAGTTYNAESCEARIMQIANLNGHTSKSVKNQAASKHADIFGFSRYAAAGKDEYRLGRQILATRLADFTGSDPFGGLFSAKEFQLDISDVSVDALPASLPYVPTLKSIVYAPAQEPMLMAFVESFATKNANSQSVFGIGSASYLSFGSGSNLIQRFFDWRDRKSGLLIV